jgi:tRNA G18 (ribose-2'-O)-methylase SpoU
MKSKWVFSESGGDKLFILEVKFFKNDHEYYHDPCNRYVGTWEECLGKMLRHKKEIERVNVQEIKDKSTIFNHRGINLMVDEKNGHIELSYEYSTGWNCLLRVYPLQKIEEFKHNY